MDNGLTLFVLRTVLPIHCVFPIWPAAVGRASKASMRPHNIDIASDFHPTPQCSLDALWRDPSSVG